jgi:hypothetical protein
MTIDRRSRATIMNRGHAALAEEKDSQSLPASGRDKNQPRTIPPVRDNRKISFRGPAPYAPRQTKVRAVAKAGPVFKWIEAADVRQTITASSRNETSGEYGERRLWLLAIECLKRGIDFRTHVMQRTDLGTMGDVQGISQRKRYFADIFTDWGQPRPPAAERSR